jgi:dihydrodipicolinate synthase/N-acetylneuraminate lyase
MSAIDPNSLIRRCRKVTGISAILLPFTETGEIDWTAFDLHVKRTADAGLTPAVNMDTGYVNLIDQSSRNQVLERTADILSGQQFVAGAFVADRNGDIFQREAYLKQMTSIQERGGTPIVFQSYGLTRQPGPEIISSYQQLAEACDRFLGFELTTDLAPFGAIYDLETFTGLMSIRQCAGAKHSSFQREPEWQRLVLRNRLRPDFVVYTGNDFAIDMITYGSDYLLGLSTFAPDLFALRDKYWANGDSRFYELNDQLQYLGHFAFRSPSPGYKHSAAQFLKLRGWISTDRTHPKSVHRPESDLEILREIGQRLNVLPNKI